DKHFKLIDYSDIEVSEMLRKILKTASELNNFKSIYGVKASTYLNFNRHWGLGTSSTLISLIAQWFDINPYQLLEQTFGGSGYDIACATAYKPILFSKNECNEIKVELCNFNPPFKNQLYFVYLNQKQNSRTAIQYYKQTKIEDRQAIIQQLNELTKIISNTTDKFEFDKCLIKHENIISSFLSLEKVQDKFFSDFNGVVKSLGAWGGDFVLVSCNLEMGYVKKYFHSKGYNNIISFNDMIQD
ncbi:MAG: GHMP kinase, partial [Bacteroidetes bacterium]|nr:GHMP kinase [Bacteroidota bacterium]